MGSLEKKEGLCVRVHLRVKICADTISVLEKSHAEQDAGEMLNVLTHVLALPEMLFFRMNGIP